MHEGLYFYFFYMIQIQNLLFLIFTHFGWDIQIPWTPWIRDCTEKLINN